MRIDAALKNATEKLRRSGSPSPWLDAEVLLSRVLKVPREHLAAHPEQPLTRNQRTRFHGLIRQRQTGIPVAYLTGTKEFFGLVFAVNRHVLIPRPESEALVETVLAFAAGRRTVTIADIGTGSGNLAIALAHHLPRAQVVAVDQSKPALAVARRNAKRLSARVRFRRGDLVARLSRIPLDVIVANLPYLPRSTALDIRQRLKHEPSWALFAGADGLAEYRRLMAQIAARKRLPSLIACEAEMRQAAFMQDLAARLLPDYRCHIHGVNGIAVIRLEKTMEKNDPRQR